jgi:hypothetical protein
MTVQQAKRLQPGDRLDVRSNKGEDTSVSPTCLRGRLDDGRGFLVFFDEQGASRMLAGYRHEKAGRLCSRIGYNHLDTNT